MTSNRRKPGRGKGYQQAVDYLKNNTSGLHWDDDCGANITTPDEERVWNAIVLSRPNCYPFKNSGWELYDAVLKLHPEKQKGDSRYSAARGVIGPHQPPPLLQPSVPPVDIPIDPALLAEDEEVLSRREVAPARSQSPDWDEAQMENDMSAGTALPDPESPSSSPPSPATPPSSAAPPSLPSPTKPTTPTPTPKPVSAKRSFDGQQLGSVKRAKVTPGEGLTAISNAIGEFSGVFQSSMERMAPRMDPSPLRRRKAMETADEKDSSWLSMDRQLELGSLLETTVKADTYMHWVTRGTPKRKRWVASALRLGDGEIDFDMAF
ncbi:hypothetical protein PQX77_020204 [Marasmius sp. AFHP31]|nr:hypothetical protein PQX77_020204 [Marasmius sp. AFHP31]